MTMDFKEIIESLLHEILQSPEANQPGKSLAQKTGALPVYFDLHMVYSLTGELKGLIHYDDGVLVEENVDTNTLHFIKAMAAQNYSELLGLKPVRDENSVDCPYCAGGTMIDQARQAGLNFVCSCGNLGWLPEL